VQMPLIDGMSDDCAACDARGLHDDCQQYGVCVAGPLELLLAPVQATFVADTFGEVLLGWHEAPISSEQWLLDDGGPNGIRFHLNSMTSGLLMGFECSMGTTDLGATVRIPLPDSDLVSLSIVAIPE